MAEVYEADNNSEMAMDSYQRAADMFANDNKKSNASQCLLKVRFFPSFFRCFFKKSSVFISIFFILFSGCCDGVRKRRASQSCWYLRIHRYGKHAKQFRQVSFHSWKFKAIEAKVSKWIWKCSTGKFSAKGHFLQCLLCHLAQGDTVQTAAKVSSCKDADYTFGASRECGFVEKLLEVRSPYLPNDCFTLE